MRDRSNGRMLWAGAGLAIGAGIGMTFGLILAGGIGIALGAAFGAGLGLVAGSALDANLRETDRRDDRA